MKKLEEYLRPTQKELFNRLCEYYHGKTVYVKGKFILVKGTAPILLVAHLDTVHKMPVQDICTSADGNILMSLQGIGGDDRCGVYALVNAYEQSAIKPHLLFTCNEETGGIGAKSFVYLHSLGKLPKSLDNLKFIVEVDRKGSNDAVYYDCYNHAFEEYITDKGYITAQGSFTDISVIAPELGIAAVNLSSGYYNAHQLHEYINRKELDATLDKILTMIIFRSLSTFLSLMILFQRLYRMNTLIFTLNFCTNIRQSNLNISVKRMAIKFFGSCIASFTIPLTFNRKFN